MAMIKHVRFSNSAVLYRACRKKISIVKATICAISIFTYAIAKASDDIDPEIWVNIFQGPNNIIKANQIEKVGTTVFYTTTLNTGFSIIEPYSEANCNDFSNRMLNMKIISGGASEFFEGDALGENGKVSYTRPETVQGTIVRYVCHQQSSSAFVNEMPIANLLALRVANKDDRNSRYYRTKRNKSLSLRIVSTKSSESNECRIDIHGPLSTESSLLSDGLYFIKDAAGGVQVVYRPMLAKFDMDSLRGAIEIDSKTSEMLIINAEKFKGDMNSYGAKITSYLYKNSDTATIRVGANPNWKSPTATAGFRELWDVAVEKCGFPSLESKRDAPLKRGKGSERTVM